MSNARTNYATISAVDYRGLNASSTYNLSITPFTFFANVPTQTGDMALTLNNTEVTFDYGDGTIEHATALGNDSFGNNILSAAHNFEFPGVYTVKMVLRDCNNNAILASQSKDIQIEDYITNTFVVTCLDLDPYYKFALSAGEYSTPLTINSQTPFYQDFQDIYFSVSGTDCPNYFNLDKNKYNQLQDYFSFYEKQFLPNLTGFQYVELTKIPLSSENLYVRLSGTELITSTTNTASSIVAGKSGTQVVYFKTQEQTLSTTPVYLSFFKDRNNIYSRGQRGYTNHNFLNNFTVSLSAIVGPSNIASLTAGDISISSNGLDNEGDELNSFRINPIQYKNTNIPFILKPKNQNQFTVNSLSAGDPELALVCRISHLLPQSGSNGCLGGAHISTDNYTITNLNDTLSSIGTNFWYRGVLKYDDSLIAASSAVVMNVELSARNHYAYVSDDAVTTEFTLTGGSSFSLYPKDYYSLYKVNEDFDFEQMIKDLRFQEILFDKNIFFTDFIGSIFGGVSSNNAGLGKKLYESIINFVQNTSDIDVCHITALDGLSKLVDNENLIYNSNHPEEIKRLINLLSIQYNKFRGYTNEFSQNFDPRNRTSKEIYATNLGDEISLLTYLVSSNTDIVAYEKFSGEYTQLNSFQPLLTADVVERSSWEEFFTNQPTISTYSLSAYNDNWGWPLVLSPGTSGTGIDQFYTFYEYVVGGTGTILNNVVDWSNPQTGIINTGYPGGLSGEPTHSRGTKDLTYSTGITGLEGDNNIFDIMIRNSLFSSLSLFEG